VLRRSRIPDNGLDERLAVSSDWWLYIAAVGRDGVYGSLPQVFARYRRNAGTVTEARGERGRLQRLGIEDSFLTTALAELTFPEWASQARSARGRLHYGELRHYLRLGQNDKALAFGRAARKSGLRWLIKASLWSTIGRIPGAAQRLLHLHEASASRGTGTSE
jgi:hypothetical protein